MSFERLYEKYRNGTASPEEIAYVEEEIAKARKLGEILEAAGSEKDLSAQNEILAEAEAEQVKKARKKHGIRSSLRALIISLVSAIAVAAIIVGSVFGSAIGAAKKQEKITEAEAKTIALDFYAANCSSSEATGEAYIKEIEKDLEFTKNLKNSYYKYTLEVGRLGGYKIEIEIDSRTGAVTLIDWE